MSSFAEASEDTRCGFLHGLSLLRRSSLGYEGRAAVASLRRRVNSWGRSELLLDDRMPIHEIQGLVGENAAPEFVPGFLSAGLHHATHLLG